MNDQANLLEEPTPKPKRATKIKEAAPTQTVEIAAPPRQMPALVGHAAPPDAIGRTLATIERLAINPAVNAASLRELFEFQGQVMERQAKMDFDAHFLALQRELPQITKDGKIVISSRQRDDGRATTAQNTPYATYENIMGQVLPKLHQHGFTLTHETETVLVGESRMLKITCVITGWGHTARPCSIELPPENTGSKNAAQAVVSANSYGRRVTASTALNLIIIGEDDDGRSAGKPKVVGEPLSDEQVEKLVELCDAVEIESLKLIDYMNRHKPRAHPSATNIRDIPASRFDEAIEALQRYDATRREKAGAEK